MGASASAEGFDAPTAACTSIARATAGCAPTSSELQKRQMIVEERKRKNALVNIAKRRRHMERHVERSGEGGEFVSPRSPVTPTPWADMCSAVEVAHPSSNDSSERSLGGKSAGSLASSEEESRHSSSSFTFSKKGLSSDTSLTAANPRGTTPLMHACSLGGHAALEIVKDLLETGADLRARDYQRWTCFLHACRSGCEPVARLLLSKGSRISEKTDDAKTAMMLACIGGHSDVLLTLVRSIESKDELVQKLRMVDRSGSTALHYACRTGSTNCIKILLRYGAAHSVADKDGRQPLMLASELGKARCVDHLLEKGAHIEAIDNKGQSALHYACIHGHDSLAVCLLEKGADPSMEDVKGETPHGFARSMNLRKFVRACERHYLELERVRQKEEEMSAESTPSRP